MVNRSLLWKYIKIGIGQIWKGAIVLSLAECLCSPGLTQNVVFDGTLNPAARRDVPLIQSIYQIPQASGLTVGNNLFHSFDRFNLSTGQLAAFLAQSNIQNILVRVTGANSSLINGILTARLANNPNTLSSANLFIVNPFGITFGRKCKTKFRRIFCCFNFRCSEIFK
ncbi:MAG: filamentous hemagglutinin N-terminal domain-containing protein [Leptolyngbyaceae cyanobacterium CSU_1_3]|nr:filamentous hemagglutinin N-terminal domain-containing protein [Leptolyngbyaceae cyanobacterium CSU_1_3]